MRAGDLAVGVAPLLCLCSLALSRSVPAVGVGRGRRGWGEPTGRPLGVSAGPGDGAAGQTAAAAASRLPLAAAAARWGRWRRPTACQLPVRLALIARVAEGADQPCRPRASLGRKSVPQCTCECAYICLGDACVVWAAGPYTDSWVESRLKWSPDGPARTGSRHNIVHYFHNMCQVTMNKCMVKLLKFDTGELQARARAGSFVTSQDSC